MTLTKRYHGHRTLLLKVRTSDTHIRSTSSFNNIPFCNSPPTSKVSQTSANYATMPAFVRSSTALFVFLVVTLFGSTIAAPKPIIGTAVAQEVSNSTVTRELQTYSATGFQALMLTAVNKQRTAYGLSKLCTNKKLQTAAQGHSNDMAAKNYMSHTGSDGSTLSQRITAAGYKWSACAENVAAGQTTVDAVMTAWMASSGHRANILSTKYTMFGVGYAYKSSTTYKHY